MAADSAATTDADMAGWTRPLMFMTADASAAGDMVLADAAMQVLAHCAGKGGAGWAQYTAKV